jgi:hypothetical protein
MNQNMNFNNMNNNFPNQFNQMNNNMFNFRLNQINNNMMPNLNYMNNQFNNIMPNFNINQNNMNNQINNNMFNFNINQNNMNNQFNNNIPNFNINQNNTNNVMNINYNSIFFPNTFFSLYQIYTILYQIRNQNYSCLCFIEDKKDETSFGFFCRILYNSKRIKVIISKYNNYIKENYNKNKTICIKDSFYEKKINLENRTIYFNEKYQLMIFEIKKEDYIDNNAFLEFDMGQDFFIVVPIYFLTSEGIVFSRLNFTKDIFEVCNFENIYSNDLLPILSCENNKVIGVFIKKDEYRKGNLFFLNNPVNEFIEEYNKINHRIIMNSNIKKKI